MAYINTNHPDFVGVGAAMESSIKSVDREPRAATRDTQLNYRPQRIERSRSPQPRSPLMDELDEDEQKESLLQYFFKKRDLKPKSSILQDGISISPVLPTPGIVTINQQTELTEKEQFEVALIRKLMMSYFEIVRQSLLDLVPKAIMHLLVNGVCQDIHPTLVEKLYDPEKFENLFTEDELIVKERSKVKELLEKYKAANEVLASI